MNADVAASILFLAGLCFVLFVGGIVADWYDARERRHRREDGPRWR